MASTKQQEHSLGQGLFGIGLIFLSVLLLMSLVSYDAFDLALFKEPPNDPPRNFVGHFGAWIGFHSLNSLGMAAYAFTGAILAIGIFCQHKPRREILVKSGWMFLCVFALACQLQLMEGLFSPLSRAHNLPGPGGLVGYALGKQVLIGFMGNVGSGILLSFVFLMGAIMIFDMHPAVLMRDLQVAIVSLWVGFKNRLASREREEEDIDIILATNRKPKPKPEKRDKKASPSPVDARQKEVSLPLPEPEPEPPAPLPLPTYSPIEPKPSKSRRGTPAPEPEAEVEEAFPVAATNAASTHWKLPPISLLNASSEEGRTSVGHSDETRQILENTLKEFGIDATITNVETGPTVTSFEVLPAPGVRVERISSLSKNLALALKAESIRVQAPIPGKGVVGIELPNVKGAKVFIRDLLESSAWKASKAALPLVVGIDVSGNKLVADLAEMPHMLIAGATGSGKSVCMNSLLAGLLMSRTPDQLRLILVDPKIVEFTAFNELPHLVVPVITDAKKVGLGLRWAINEMEKRYKMFAKVGVRNIKAFNTRKINEQGDLFDLAADENPEAGEKTPTTLPYIVIVIDELADLMMVAQSEIENSIARLAQLSRAVGIHMILATQRPSVNVITGTIKANFPARIAFQVAQKVDSRTILDANGADNLLGKGDMLFLPPGVAKLIRAQGAMTTDEEIVKIVNFIKEQGVPEYESIIKDKIESKLPEIQESDEDNELVEAAIEVIRQSRRASTSSLQRRLRIGYNRAARLMDQLEERGVVGPPQGSDPREILIDLDGEIPSNDDAPDEES